MTENVHEPSYFGIFFGRKRGFCRGLVYKEEQYFKKNVYKKYSVVLEVAEWKATKKNKRAQPKNTYNKYNSKEDAIKQVQFKLRWKFGASRLEVVLNDLNSHFDTNNKMYQVKQ